MSKIELVAMKFLVFAIIVLSTVSIGHLLLKPNPPIPVANFRLLDVSGNKLELSCQYSHASCLIIYNCSNGKSYYCITNVEMY